MPTPISAELYVDYFAPTGTPGEYTFSDATFNNQADVTGNGTYGVQVGHVIYVPASDPNTGMPIPGILHRYKLTSVTPVDFSTLSGVMLWDEAGTEEDSPAAYVRCLLTEVTPNRKLGLIPPDALYFQMTPGTSLAALEVDVRNIHDTSATGGSGESVLRFSFPASVQWVVTHNRGTTSFVESLKDINGDRFFASLEVLDSNSFAVNLTEALAGSVDVIFASA